MFEELEEEYSPTFRVMSTAIDGEASEGVPLCTCNGIQNINLLQPIVPNVDLPLHDDKCNFWNHFEMAIFLSLYLFQAF